MSKKYGLIVPGLDKVSAPPKADFTKSSVFGSESSDSDNGNGPQLSKMRSATIGPGLTERRQARMIQQKALAEDPTIFQYDELYDDIESKRDQEKNSKTNEIKKPKYINRLLVQAERRKLENERRIERGVQKEREAEGEQFKDKESYVTSSYKKKLEELQQAEEEEKRQDYLESIGDVRKQQDLGGFYRHIYEQKLGRNETNKSDNVQTNNQISINNKEDSPQEDTQLNTTNIKLTKPRTYRKRHSSDEENEIVVEKDTSGAKKAHIQSNLDADSDFSIDSSSDSDDSNKIEKQSESNKKLDKKEVISEKIEIKLEPIIENDKNETNNNIDNKTIKINEEKFDEKPKEIKPKKSKIDIWKKRTVGDVFEAALQRYFERKSARNA